MRDFNEYRPAEAGEQDKNPLTATVNGTSKDLVRLQVYLRPHAYTTVSEMAKKEGVSRAEWARRALSLYVYLAGELAQGKDLYVGNAESQTRIVLHR